VKFCLICLKHDCAHFHLPAYLTDKEIMVLNLIGKGRAYKVVAAALNCSTGGLRQCIQRIFKALNSNSKGELIAFAIEHKEALTAAQKVIQESPAWLNRRTREHRTE
jgi:DNA-binding CsgD family transcriptional regulator